MNSGTKITNLTVNHPVLLDRRNVYHQAGHAVAIYRGNNEKQLPDVYFHLNLIPINSDTKYTGKEKHKSATHSVKVMGGRLVENLTLPFDQATQHLTYPQKVEYRRVFEADIINLLVGSLAEANHLAMHSGQIFNVNEVFLGTLNIVGGFNNSELINEYLSCLIPDDPFARNKKLANLYLAAYSFVNEQSNWAAITALAEAITEHPKRIMSCEEVISVLEPVYNPPSEQLIPQLTDYPKALSAR